MTSLRTSEQRADPGIWRLPEVWWIFTARVASVAGDWIYQIALIWLVLQITGSTIALSAVSVAQVIPLLVMSSLFSGRIVNVISARGLAVVDLAQATVVMAFPVLYWAGYLDLPWFIAISIVITILDSISDPGLQALVPQLCDRSQIPVVHSVLDLTKRLGRIIGPGFSSLLLIVMPVAGLFVVDAGSFLVSAFCMLAAGRLVLRRRGVRRLDPPAGEQTAQDDPAQPAGHIAPGEPGFPPGTPSLRRTYRYLRQNPILIWLFTIRNLENMLWSVYLIGVPVLVQRSYHQGAGVWGLLIAVYSVGQLGGNYVTTRLRGFRTVARYVVIGWLVAGVGFAGLGLSPSPVLGGMWLLISGAGSAAANVSSDSYVGVAVPPALQPAAFSWQFSGNQITQLLGMAGFGVLLHFVQAGRVVFGTGLAMVTVVVAGGLLGRRIKAHEVRVAA